MQSYSVLGGRLAFDPQPSECQAQLAWDVGGDRLTMRLVADDCPDAFGARREALVNRCTRRTPGPGDPDHPERNLS